MAVASGAKTVNLLGDRGNTIDWTVDDAVAIAKGSVLKISADPRVASLSLGAADESIAGISTHEKVVSDGQTMSCYTNGIFDLVVSGSTIVLGQQVASAGDNYIIPATALASGAGILGIALETGSAGEVVEVRVNL